MNRRNILSISAITALGLAMVPGSTVAQQKSLKEQLVGTWTPVSITTKRPDGSLQWGSNPKGIAIFTDNGRFSESVMRSDRTSLRRTAVCRVRQTTTKRPHREQSLPTARIRSMRRRKPTPFE
jgi:hypothetical protein